MASVIKSVTFDAVDALALATFRAAVFGQDVDEDSTADRAFVGAAGTAMQDPERQDPERGEFCVEAGVATPPA